MYRGEYDTFLSEHNTTEDLPREVRLFAQKTARSIIEVQPNVNNVADIVVLLEVLGYAKSLVMKNGFRDLYALANYIYSFLDVYENKGENKEKFLKSFTMPIPGLTRRVVEAVGMIFPWLGSLVLLSLTGVSLWMAWGLPIQITTAFVIGVFLGLFISEGLLQIFSRLFGFYHEQTNIGEVKRLLKRSYCLLSAILCATVLGLYAYAYFERLPNGLIEITIVSTVTIAIHRASFMIIYALKKLGHLILSYSGAFASLLLVYFFSASLIEGNIERYFTSLAVAFVILSGFAAYNHYRIIVTSLSTETDVAKPHFFRPISRTDKTIRSRFVVQLWETLPSFLFGTFYFVMMFADRIISWSFNPLITANGVILPLGFNSIYHSGADLALVVLLPTSVIQYVMMSPIFMRVNNLAVTLKVSDMKKINQFLQGTYKRLLTISLVTSVGTMTILNFLSFQILPLNGFSHESIQILHLASIGNVFMSIFSANSLFLMMLDKRKSIAIIAMVSAFIVIAGGIMLGRSGIENITLAYLASSITAAILSILYILKIFKHIGSMWHARFV